MKKLILLGALLLVFSGCTEELNPEKIFEKGLNPYREYQINDTKVAKLVEDGILETEAATKGLDLKKSSAHLISYTKLGQYGSGEIRILAYFTDEGLKRVNDNITYGTRITNKIINFTCKFEYSYKNGQYTWTTNFPYDL